jgi:hypothetical protein
MVAEIGSNALLGYDLRTFFGPLTAIPGSVGYPERLFVHTTLGNQLHLERIANA